MKRIFFIIPLFLLSAINKMYGQYSGSFVVNGDLDKYYPVIFQDLNFSNNKATEFEIGRSIVHTNGQWRGSLISKFRVHTTNYGHGSNFIDANISQFNPVTPGTFIAGWTDATIGNGNQIVIIWLKGGTNTYYLNSPVNISPIVYDGVQHPLPYQEENGPSRSYKTGIDSYVNSSGENSGGSAYYTGGSNNYFAGNVGIGTTSPDTKLTVNGSIHSKEVKVDLNVPGPDYVFEKNYNIRPLAEVENYIAINKHLPEIPSAKSMGQNGINIGELNMKMLQKIEELTLYLIEKDKQLKLQGQRMLKMERQMKALVKAKK